MSFQRLGFRMGQRLMLRSPASAPSSAAIRSRVSLLQRQMVQRRFASEQSGPKLTGAADNAFNREREAVKHHAAETSGE